MTNTSLSSDRTPIDELLTAARVATFADRAAPLPRDLRAALEAAADEALAFLAERSVDPSMFYAEQLLVGAAFAAAAYPLLQAPLTALAGACDLMIALRPEPEAAPTRWEQRAGLMS